jgi:cytochrome P460
MFHYSIVPVLKRLWSPAMAQAAVLLALFGSLAFAAQDRYTLKLGKLEFADFRGYENWKDVAVSQTETLMKVIVANDLMMEAYKQGLPASGKLFPDGVKIVKIEWTFKRNTVAPYFVNVPDTLKAVAVIEKDTKRFPDTHGWAYGNFNYDAASDTFTPEGSWRHKITFTRRIPSGERVDANRSRLVRSTLRSLAGRSVIYAASPI